MRVRVQHGADTAPAHPPTRTACPGPVCSPLKPTLPSGSRSRDSREPPERQVAGTRPHLNKAGGRRERLHVRVPRACTPPVGLCGPPSDLLGQHAHWGAMGSKHEWAPWC